jgi:hypothetical protein
LILLVLLGAIVGMIYWKSHGKRPSREFLNTS